MSNRLISGQVFRYIILAFFILILIISSYDVNAIRDFFYNIVATLDKNRFSNIILIFLLFVLRSISIVVPVLPGTIFSVAAGFQFGFTQRLVIIFIADFLS